MDTGAMTKGLYKNMAAQLAKNGNVADAPAVVAAAGERYAALALLERRNYQTPGALEHLFSRILPAIAFYEALKGPGGLSALDAKSLLEGYVFGETERLALTLKKLGRLPFFWALFKPIARKRMARSFPGEGWGVEWHSRRGGEVAFDMRSCLYYDLFQKYGCAELCEIFCNVDRIAYGDMSRSVDFLRTRTIAGGGESCDFRFIKN